MDDHFDICHVFEIRKFDIVRLTCIRFKLKKRLIFWITQHKKVRAGFSSNKFSKYSQSCQFEVLGIIVFFLHIFTFKN